MMKNSFISKTVEAALNQWDSILFQLNITVPANHKHGACPHFGGKDRFRFDDLQGRGTWICNFCGAGDGLKLVMNVLGCSAYDAAKKVADYLCVGEVKPVQSPCRTVPSEIQKHVNELLAKCIQGQSPYLVNKGLEAFSCSFPVLEKMKFPCAGVEFGAGSLVLTLQNIKQQVTGAQLISPSGEKRLIAGSVLKESYIILQHQSNITPLQIVITEGVATGLSIADFIQNPQHEISIFAAISANNLTHVALRMKQQYPDSNIIIAGDNDIHQNHLTNIGKIAAEKAALAVKGKVTLPPTNYKADWNDYLCEVGCIQAKEAFKANQYIPVQSLLNDFTLKDEKIDYKSSGTFTLNHKVQTLLPIRYGSEGYDTQQDFLIKGYLPCHALTCIYGPSGSYKSFLAIDWACRVATGFSWAEKRVAQGTVIYVVGEGGIGVPRRIKAWEKKYNDGQPVENLVRIECPVFPASPESLNQLLDTIEIIKNTNQLPIRLIVLDTLARCFGGNDENAAKDMGAFIQGCDILKAKTQATILLVHHSGKDLDKGARGSSALRAALDAEFNVRREKENNHEDKAFILTCTKMKDAEEPDKNAYDLRPIELYYDEDNELISSLVVIDSPRTAQKSGVNRYPELKGVPNLTNNHIALWECIRNRTQENDSCTKAIIRDDLRAMGLDVDKKFSRWLSKLIDAGVILIEEDVIRVDIEIE